jgi:hypothetical protein
VQGYVVAKGRRDYAVVYDGIDPITGRERRHWEAAGNDRREAELLATQLARRFATAHRDVGLSLARYLLEQWLPAKRVSLRPSTWDGYRRKTTRGASTLSAGFAASKPHRTASDKACDTTRCVYTTVRVESPPLPRRRPDVRSSPYSARR